MTVVDTHYQTLLRVLDSLCKEAPVNLSSYHATGEQQKIQARSRAFIHLFLKARFGVGDFGQREKLITDGKGDGGVDAYFIDHRSKLVYLLQSKFRASAQNFSGSNMSAEDMIKMDISRILKGEKRNEFKIAYNERIAKFQSDLRKIPDIGVYEYKVVLLGNCKTFTSAQLKNLVGGYSVDQFDHNRAFAELLFPIINGTYYSDPHLIVEIRRNGAGSEVHLDYDLVVGGIGVNVKLLYVPTQEIARIMYTYKNSILFYNPRSFLEVSKNAVNREILESLRKDVSNEFALFNNGITIVSEQTSLSTNTGKVGLTQLVLKAPQLINGAQTAYSLSLAYAQDDMKVFKKKEVLLRVITFTGKAANLAQREKLIARISRASNLQTRVDEADRRSNDELQVALQREFFSRHGLYYERKRGEFSEGLRQEYIDRSSIINRELLVRVALAIAGRVSHARSSIAKYFGADQFSQTLKVADVSKYVFGYLALKHINTLKARSGSDPYRLNKYGSALRYGQYAVVYVAVQHYMKSGLTPAEASEMALSQWKKFEAWARRRSANAGYVVEGVLDGVRYYKGQTLNNDLAKFSFSATRRRAKRG